MDYRAQCFSCHNNGPRAIRAEVNSADAALGIRDRLKIQAWNLRIKTYGRIVFDSTMDIEDSKFPTAFRDKDARMNEMLKVGVCTHCHKEDGFLSRGALRLQQRGTIQHLVSTKQMPPLGFEMTQKEQLELQDFVRGFN